MIYPCIFYITQTRFFYQGCADYMSYAERIQVKLEKFEYRAKVLFFMIMA